MLAERRRAARLLRDRSLAPFWLARLADQAGGWVLLLVLLVSTWADTHDVTLLCWVLVALLLPRLVVTGLLDGWARVLPPRALPLLPALHAAIAGGVAVLLVWGPISVEQIAIGSAAALGFLGAVSNETRHTAVRAEVDATRHGSATIIDALVDRGAVLVGGLVGAALLAVTSPSVAAAMAAVAIAAAAAITFVRSRRSDGRVHAAPEPPATDTDPRSVARRTAIYLVAAFTSGALGAVLLISVVPLATAQPGWPIGAAGLLLASAGLGMLIGALPVERVLLRVSAPMLLLATVTATGVAALAIGITHSLIVAVPAFILFGAAAATQDALRAVCLRRIVPADIYGRVSRLAVLALVVGQIYGAVSIVSTAPNGDVFTIMLLLAVAQLVLIGLAILLGRRESLRGGLSSLPIRSVVHKLSWDTAPAATPAQLAPSEPRIRRLARWIQDQSTLERLHVTLPVSGREYDIYRPEEAARERLFEAGRADPDKQMPYWAKVWPSGVALADVVVERKREVTDQHVLELGAGLGVTACAVLEYGGHLITADYSALPLAICRLNTLVNTDRAPRATCFNWRHDAEVTAAISQPDFSAGFPLIIAGDVLYEGRDADPLLNVIERLLNAEGSLWLAEPVRRTAQRFLDSAAALGWEIESRQVQADWPDATNGPVNVHFLKRSAEADRIIGNLGGWRI
jgi:predicted nicotinamide N-methyase